MKSKTHFSKRILSLMLSALMVVTMLPTFVFSSPTTAEAQDTKSMTAPYWSILASSDFTQTTWSGSGSDYTLTVPATAKGGNTMQWKIKYSGTHTNSLTTDGAQVIVNKRVTENADHSANIVSESANNGVGFPWVSNNFKFQGAMYMSQYNNQATNNIFSSAANGGTAVNNFKIDLAFSFTDTAKCNSGYNLTSEREDSNVSLLKLANDSSYKYSSKFIHEKNWYNQAAWGKRNVSTGNKENTNYFYADGSHTASSSNHGGKFAITTNDNESGSVIAVNQTYHYVVYYVDKMIGTYITDDSGNVLVNYNPIEMGSFNLTPDQITSLYLGIGEFNTTWGAYYDMENIAYKSIEIYKGNSTSTYDSTRDKFLYAYFTGNDDAGETMHYAISQDGVNFEAVSGGAKVWNPSTNGATDTYPATDSAPNSDGIAISNHVRDTYAFIGQDGSDYVIATDLNTNNGSVYSNNSRFLVWNMDYFGDIADTRPWSIDTSRLPGMDAVTNNNNVVKAWAPQAIWDPDVGKYMLYWTAGENNNTHAYIYYTYTSDFKTDFTSVKRLLYPDFDGSGITNHIDADITYHNGLYYCYFKNEDSSGTGSKRIWYAVAPNANGPYTDFELFETNYQSEGPQVYETTEGSYMLMIDGYGNSTYHMYSAGSPYEFDASDESSTNVTSLSPRHGSIVRITTAEYNKLKKLRIGEELRYQWQTTGNYSHSSEQTDSTGNKYHVTWNPSASTTTTGNGVLSLTDSGMYCELTTVQNFIASDVYTVTFYYKSNGSTTRDDNHSIFSISRSDAVSNYVRLSSNGKFIVNNSQVAVSGNCSDGTTTRASKLSSAVTDTANFHRFTVTSDGLITSLIIDGEFICQTISGMDIPSTLWITFGWARISGVENNRLTAQFGQIVFKNVATDTGKQDELYATNVPSSFSSAVDGVGKYYGNAAHKVVNGAVDANTKGYSNVAYCSNTTNMTSGADKFWTVSKVALPNKAVVAYDGVHNASIPVVYESGWKKSANSSMKTGAFTDTTNLALTHRWIGYTNSGNSGESYTVWPGTVVSTTSNYKTFDNVYSSSSYTDSGDFNSDGNSWYWWNELKYNGNMTSGGNTIYTATFTNPQFFIRGYSYGNGTQETTFNSSGTMYVVNYKPIYDIVKSGSTSYIKVDGAATTTNISTLFSTDANNRWKYTKESYVQAAYAMKLLNDCNPVNFFANENDDTVATRVTQYQAAVEKAIAEFNKIDLVTNKFNITYRMANGTTYAEVVTAGNYLANVPSNTATYHIFDSNTHMKNCRWTSVSAEAVPSGASAYNPSATPSTSVTPKANTIYTETGTVEDCETAHVAADGDTNGYTRYECSICGETNDDYKMWDDRTTDWTAYNSALTAADTVKSTTDFSQYTTSSVEAFNDDYDDATEDVDPTDETKSETYIDTRADLLTNALRKLNEKAIFTTLDNNVNTENAPRATPSTYTYSSWYPYATAYDTANGIKTNSTDYPRDNTPRYATDENDCVIARDENHLSVKQGNINTAATNLNAKYSELATIPVEQYTNYESARTIIINSLDPRKYTATGIATITGGSGAITNANTALYHTLTEGEADVYNSNTGGGYAEGDPVRNESVAATVDEKTGDILTASTTLNTAVVEGTEDPLYIRQYDVTLTLKDAEKDIDDIIDYDEDGFTNGVKTYSGKYYGDSLDIVLPNGIKNNYSIANWSATNLDVDNGDASTGSQKAASNVGYTLTKIVNSKIAVVVELGKNTLSDNQYRYNICNVYGAVKDVKYGNYDTVEASAPALSDGNKTITINGNVQPVDELPFYDFDGWTVSYNANSRTYTIKPQYTVAASTYVISVTGGTASNSRPKFDEIVTVSSNVDNFAAWAVLKDSKYQIASYSANYSFYACTDEAYVAIVSNGSGGYRTSDGTEITYDKIDGQLQDVGSEAANNNLVNAKIAGKLPFISIQKVDMYDKKEVTAGNLYTKARVYARVTEGSANDNGFGVLFREGAATDSQMVIGYDENTKSRTVTNILSTGQFTYTLNRSRGFEVDVTFRGYVNYNATYTAAGSSSTINALDYSKIGISRHNA